MAVVLETNIVLVKSVPQTLFEASAGQLPGIFEGQVDLTQLLNAADEVDIQLQTKYSSGGTFRNAEKPSLPGKQIDNIFRLTPLQATYGYKLTIELLAASPSAGATLEVLILRSVAPA